MKEQIWHQHYDPGVKPSLEYPSCSVASFLEKTAQKVPEKTALIFGELAPLLGEQHDIITFGKLNSLVDHFAAGLQQMGLQKEDRVALYMPNCPQFVIAYYGVLRAGGIAVPCNPLYVAREIEHQLNDAGAKFAVVLSKLYDNVKKVRDETPLEQVIVTNIKAYLPGLLKLLFTVTKERKDGHYIDISNDANTVWFQDFLKQAPPSPHSVGIFPDDTAVLMYTGGTTGVPKGAQLTHGNVVANAIQSAEWLSGGGSSRTGQEIMVTALPLTHSYSMTISMNLSIINGYPQIIIPDPRNIEHVLTSINIHKPTLFPGVPNLYNALNNHPGVKAGKYDLHSINLCLCGAAPLPVEVQEKFQRITGGKLVEGYGLSETSPVNIGNPLASGGRIGTIGVPLPDTEAKIVDLETGSKTLGPGEKGELCVHGPQVMKGYWNMPTETANALRVDADGKLWFHTGDVAEMSDDGYFRLVDRQKEMILASGGFNVYPRDIEERLYEHPKVMEAAAIGVPVDSSDQRVKVFVVRKEGKDLSEDELIEWCREGLAKYKIPKFVEFRDELPKTMVGKILRRQLMEEEEEEQDSDSKQGTEENEETDQ